PRPPSRRAPLRESNAHGRAGPPMSRTLVASDPAALGPLLRGVLAFPITPYATDGAVDLDAVGANAHWLAGSGMHALVAPSGTGELFSLTPEECAAVVRATVEAAAGRVPVIAGVGFGPRVAADLARQAERDGADGILVLPPYYAHPDPDALVAYYRQVADATALGLAIYARDSVTLAPPALPRLRGRGDEGRDGATRPPRRAGAPPARRSFGG